MQQQSELAKVKARIRALAAKTVERGCSEAEAMAAAAKVGELLDVYGLSMSEVELREETCVQQRLATLGPGRLALRWLFPSVLRFCECRGWTDGRQDFVLFGLLPDVQMAEYLLRVIEGALAWEEGRYRRSPAYLGNPLPGQAILRSFRYGFADRVAKRLDAMADERQQAVQARRTAGTASGTGLSGTGLPGTGLPGTGLVLAKSKKVEEGMRGLGVRLRTVTSTATIRDRGAYGDGRAAGGRVGLGRPVGAGPGIKGVR